MVDDNKLIESAHLTHMSDHYKQASEELLHAYQRNKEATRHHEAGAFRAALHHAKLSKHHSFNAHEHLKDALVMAEKLESARPGSDPLPRPSLGSAMH